MAMEKQQPEIDGDSCDVDDVDDDDSVEAEMQTGFLDSSD